MTLAHIFVCVINSRTVVSMFDSVLQMLGKTSDDNDDDFWIVRHVAEFQNDGAARKGKWIRRGILRDRASMDLIIDYLDNAIIAGRTSHLIMINLFSVHRSRC